MNSKIILLNLALSNKYQSSYRDQNSSESTKFSKRYIKKLRKLHVYPAYYNYGTKWDLFNAYLLHFIFIFNNNTFTCLNNFYFNTNEDIYPIHSINHRPNNYLLWKFDRLSYFKQQYNLKTNQDVFKFLITQWPFLDNQIRYPLKFIKHPWRGRRKGTLRQINKFYGKFSYLMDDFITIATQNKSLIPMIIKTITFCFDKLKLVPNYEIRSTKAYLWYFDVFENIPIKISHDHNKYYYQDPSYWLEYTEDEDEFEYRTWWYPLYQKNEISRTKHYKVLDFALSEDRHNLEKYGYPHSFYVKQYWSIHLQQLLLCKIMAQVPLPYWNIYSHKIMNYDQRKSLLNTSARHIPSASHKAVIKDTRSFKYYQQSNKKFSVSSGQSEYFKASDFY